MSGFEFQRLRVFDAAADAATAVHALARRVPLHLRVMRDQLLRAAISVPLNTAEGADEFSRAEKVRFYRMARRSAAESAAALVLLVRFGVFTPNEVERAIALLNQTAAMLTSMMAGLETSTARTAPVSKRSEPVSKSSEPATVRAADRAAPASAAASAAAAPESATHAAAAAPAAAPPGPGPGPWPRPASRSPAP